jgi:hypothetical protein
MPLHTKRRFLISLQLGSIYLTPRGHLRLAQRHVWRKATRGFGISPTGNSQRPNALI